MIYNITRVELLKDYENNSRVETSLLRSLMKNYKNGLCNEMYNYHLDSFKYDVDDEINRLRYSKLTEIKYKDLDFALENVVINVAKDFGLVTFEMEDIEVFIRSIPNYAKMSDVHIHNDVLHFEISHGKNNYFSDQGSYIYTPLIRKRDEFRSIKAHNVPNHNIEPNEFIDCFKTLVNVQGQIIELSCNTIGMIIRFNDIVHYRKISFERNKMSIIDKSNHEFEYECKEFDLISLGYGKMLNRTKNMSEIQ